MTHNELNALIIKSLKASGIELPILQAYQNQNVKPPKSAIYTHVSGVTRAAWAEVVETFNQAEQDYDRAEKYAAKAVLQVDVYSPNAGEVGELLRDYLQSAENINILKAEGVGIEFPNQLKIFREKDEQDRFIVRAVFDVTLTYGVTRTYKVAAAKFDKLLLKGE